MTIYLKYDGIDGEVTESKHPKWIEVNSFQFGVGRGISSPTGGSANREASIPSVSEITVTKQLDASSIKLVQAALAGEGKKVTIDFVTAGTGKEPVVYAQYELEGAMVSGYSVSSGGDRPSESLSINFTSFQYKNIGGKTDNTSGTPVFVKYNLGEAKVG